MESYFNITLTQTLSDLLPRVDYDELSKRLVIIFSFTNTFSPYYTVFICQGDLIYTGNPSNWTEHLATPKDTLPALWSSFCP
jgi:hypothetical protein